jgi:hypothetical protein
MTTRNNEWFLTIDSESTRDKTESFYWDTKERLDRLAFYIQRGRLQKSFDVNIHYIKKLALASLNKHFNIFLHKKLIFQFHKN